MNYWEEEEEGRSKVYGTPLPPLEQNENATKKPELDMTVRDKQGRRRFHGAFTGGFSAGHFNTVGTVEGWIPSQFKSSRVEKWSRDLLKQQPEDYMDEDDLDVFGIAHRTVKTTDNFTGDHEPSTSGFAGFRADSSKSIVDVLKDVMIKPAKQSIGVRIMKIMKRDIVKPEDSSDQEIKTEESTSRLREKEDENSEKAKNAKVYGCLLPPHLMNNKLEIEPDQDDQDNENVESSPDLPYKPKVDKHGLGYKGLDYKSVTSKKTASNGLELSATIEGKKLKIAGEAFGTGALSDEEDLDEDAEVYGKDNIDQYDFAIGGKGDRKRTTWKGTSSVLNMDKLEGFVVESKGTRSTFTDLSNKYRPPNVPREWRPHPPWYKSGSTSLDKSSSSHRDKDRDGKRKSRWDISADEVKREASEAGHSKKERRDDDSKDDKRGEKFKGVKDEKSSSTSRSAAPQFDANVRALLMGERVAKASPVVPSPSTSSEQHQQKNAAVQEQQRQQALVNLRPLSGFFANKFTRSDTSALEQNILAPGLIKVEVFAAASTSGSGAEDASNSGTKDEDSEKSDIGSVRRCEFPWLPHRLLCKRFNVPQPNNYGFS